MTWLSAMPVAVVAALCVLAPGLPFAYALGLRGITAWGVAPVVSIGSVAVGAIVGGRIGLGWSPVVAVAAALVLAVLTIAARFVVRRLRPSQAPQEADGWMPAAGTAIGLTVAVLIGFITAREGMGRPDALSQTYDAVFHYNVVAKILAEGNASPFVVGTLTNPTASEAFYPAAWHAMVSLIVLISGGSIPLVSNMLAIVVTTVLWPLACLTLVRQVVGRSAAASVMTPVVSVGFIAFPWSLLTFGVLWPNLIGLAMVPIGLAAVITLCGLSRESPLTPGKAVVVGAVASLSLALAHPNTLFSLAALSTVPVLWWFAGWVRARARVGSRIVPSVAVVAVVGVSVAAAGFLTTSPLFDDVRSFDWPAFETPAQAAGEVLLNATNRKDAAWAISLVVIIGFIAAARTRHARWLIPAHLLSGGLFLMAAALETPLSAALTGFWYNDSYRLAAMVPITGVPLAVLGLLLLGSQASRQWSERRGVSPDPSRRSALAGPGLFALIATIVLILSSSGMYIRDHANFLTASYPSPADSSLINPDEEEFFNRIEALIPPDAVVAQNPWSGSSLLWPLTGRRVLFPHLVGNWTPDQLYLAERLRDAATDNQICTIANRLGVRYLLVGNNDFWPWDGRRNQYPGLARPEEGSGFETVAEDGHGNQLFRLTACRATPSP